MQCLWWEQMTPGIFLRSPTAAGRGTGCKDTACVEKYRSGDGRDTGTVTHSRQCFSPTLPRRGLQLEITLGASFHNNN